MKNDWPTKDDDLDMLAATIDKHIDLNDGEPVGLFEIAVEDGERVGIRMSPWVDELAENLSERYGLEDGMIVMKRVLSQCLINGSTVH